mmetsp:Transcript_6535/g.17148  ORF Transcript_6535/g.17148 Transcript_6535/m.17148 type:complete len:463 (-) Transcript_6535:445-1833(-)
MLELLIEIVLHECMLPAAARRQLLHGRLPLVRHFGRLHGVRRGRRRHARLVHHQDVLLVEQRPKVGDALKGHQVAGHRLPRNDALVRVRHAQHDEHVAARDGEVGVLKAVTDGLVEHAQLVHAPAAQVRGRQDGQHVAAAQRRRVGEQPQVETVDEAPVRRRKGRRPQPNRQRVGQRPVALRRSVPVHHEFLLAAGKGEECAKLERAPLRVGGEDGGVAAGERVHADHDEHAAVGAHHRIALQEAKAQRVEVCWVRHLVSAPPGCRVQQVGVLVRRPQAGAEVEGPLAAGLERLQRVPEAASVRHDGRGGAVPVLPRREAAAPRVVRARPGGAEVGRASDYHIAVLARGAQQVERPAVEEQAAPVRVLHFADQRPAGAAVMADVHLRHRARHHVVGRNQHARVAGQLRDGRAGHIALVVARWPPELDDTLHLIAHDGFSVERQRLGACRRPHERVAEHGQQE